MLGATPLGPQLAGGLRPPDPPLAEGLRPHGPPLRSRLVHFDTEQAQQKMQDQEHVFTPKPKRCTLKK